LKYFLGIDASETSNDPKLTRALNLAGPAIETFLDRVVAERLVVEDFRHHFGTVVLHNSPVQPGVVVKIDGVADTGYEVYTYRKLAYLTRQGFRPDVPMDWRRFERVEVEYTAGFNPVPSDLAYAIVMTAGSLYAAEGTGAAPGGSSGDIKMLQIYDVGSVSYDVGAEGATASPGISNPGIISSQAAEVLSRYKRIQA
jgi:hypothetical protein